jgi:hypothetical protein
VHFERGKRIEGTDRRRMEGTGEEEDRWYNRERDGRNRTDRR